MALTVPFVVGIIFFAVNTVALLCVAVYAAKQKSKNIFSVFWPQRLIYAALIILFLDQATDIAVLINWYTLMEDGIDYISINEMTFFYPLLVFFCVYVFIMMLTTCESTQLYDILLVLFFIYPFKAAYTSFMESYEAMEHNASLAVELGKEPQKMKSVSNVNDEPKEDADKEEKQEIMEDTNGNDIESGDTDDKSKKGVRFADDTEDNNNKDEIVAVVAKEAKVIQLSEIMARLLIVQCTLETMPGLVLQSVFWVRSFNDPLLIGRNSTFIAISIICSLMSLASRYLWIIDVEFVTDKAKNLVYRAICITYRVLSILASFIVFVMIWVVMGGVWIGLWIMAVYVMWTIIAVINGDSFCSAQSFKSGVQDMIGVTLDYSWKWHLLKFVEDLIGMVLIFVFLWSKFECGICVSGETRDSYRGSNNRIAFLFALGWISSIGAFVIYVFLHFSGVIKSKKE